MYTIDLLDELLQLACQGHELRPQNLGGAGARCVGRRWILFLNQPPTADEQLQNLLAALRGCGPRVDPRNCSPRLRQLLEAR